MSDFPSIADLTSKDKKSKKAASADVSPSTQEKFSKKMGDIKKKELDL